MDKSVRVLPNRNLLFLHELSLAHPNPAPSKTGPRRDKSNRRSRRRQNASSRANSTEPKAVSMDETPLVRATSRNPASSAHRVFQPASEDLESGNRRF